MSRYPLPDCPETPSSWPQALQWVCGCRGWNDWLLQSTGRTNQRLNDKYMQGTMLNASVTSFGSHKSHACVHAKSLWLCLTLCNPMNCSPPGSSVHGILQARILEWVVMPSRGSSRPRDRTHVSCLLGWQAGSLPLVPPGKPHQSHMRWLLLSSLFYRVVHRAQKVWQGGPRSQADRLWMCNSDCVCRAAFSWKSLPLNAFFRERGCHLVTLPDGWAS